MNFITEMQLRQELLNVWALVEHGKKDTERLEWLMRNVSGMRFSDVCSRDKIDALMRINKKQNLNTTQIGAKNESI